MFGAFLPETNLNVILTRRTSFPVLLNVIRPNLDTPLRLDRIRITDGELSLRPNWIYVQFISVATRRVGESVGK